MDCIQDLFVLMRAGDSKNTGVMIADVVRLGAQTTGDNHLAVFSQGLANRIQTFSLGAVQKPAGVHDHGVGA